MGGVQYEYSNLSENNNKENINNLFCQLLFWHPQNNKK